MDQKYILAIDQGTSSTKSTIFDEKGNAIARGQVDLATQFLDGGMVEQDPLGIFENVLASVSLCLEAFRRTGKDTGSILSIGISNQRETFVVWDANGDPLHNAVVWQCKRSIDICNQLINGGFKKTVKERTGLIIDPYFSASKLIWLYQNKDKVRAAIDTGNAYFGTIDTWLLFKLTGGKRYLTDHTNASRTMLFNLSTLNWDTYLLATFGLDKINLPEVIASSSDFGASDFGGSFDREIPIGAMIGDSHAAAFGEGCFEQGQAKATLGTGCSIMMNAGTDLPSGSEGVVTTICWSTSTRVDYGLEGVIVSCGSTMEWLRRELTLFSDIKQTQDMANSVLDNNGVYIIPAFSGMGAPYWQMDRKGELLGLTFNTSKNHIVRAGLESIAYQIRSVIDAMENAAQLDLRMLIVNGGIISNNFVLGFLTDLLNKPLYYGISDASGLGAAMLAGLQAGLFESLEEIKALAKPKSTVMPTINPTSVQVNYHTWLAHVNRTYTDK